MTTFVPSANLDGHGAPLHTNVAEYALVGLNETEKGYDEDIGVVVVPPDGVVLPGAVL